MSFTHLHVHSDFSILDSMAKIKNIVKKVKENGMTACAITDHGVGYGLVEFYTQCKEQGIKPILGCEFYVAPTSRFSKEKDNHVIYNHLVILVKDQTGYKNLCKLISRSNTEGFYYKPRIDFELLSEFHEGLICLSACVAGEIPRDILNGDFEKAEKDILKYKNLFGDDFYLEIQNHGLQEEQVVSQHLVRFSKKFGVKLVCTNDCHYVDSEDAEAHDWMLCIQHKKNVQDEERIRYFGDYSIKTEEDMRSLFPNLPEAFDNTMEIAEKCNFEFEFGNYRMPKVIIPVQYGENYFTYLADETWKGWEERYPVGHPLRNNAKDRVIYELNIVKQMGFAEYFLDTRKTIMWAKSHDILVGPGRGSAAGSVMCYCLKITDLEPLRYNLLFERFLNPERISMPDIDVDYDYAFKDEIVKSEAESNGYDHFSKIQTFNCMLAKSVLKDCARVAGYPVEVGVKLSQMIPTEPEITLEKAYDKNPEIAEYISSDKNIEKLWNIALKLEGLKKSVGTHACGHIPTPVPCEDMYPVSVDTESGYLVCQYNMTEAEHIGALKKDLLMLRNLSLIHIAQKDIKKRHDIEVPLWNEEILNDKDALYLFKTGDTNGVFQFESEGMKKFIKDLQPDCFEDVIAAVSLYRPGPMDFIPDYIRGKKNPEQITYLTPELKSILAPTYGVIVYQEQVMQIVQKLAGFSMGRADLVRKAMGKKKMDIMQAERQNFVYGNEDLQIPGCKKNGISEEIANQIYDQMIDFAKYAFNKSHAACYAAISMQTAYLKAHYPVEFNAGLLSSVMDDTEKIAKYQIECKKKGIKILPPDINSSDKDFAVVGNDQLSYGLLTIKGVGADVIDSILEDRKANGKFKGLTDYVKRMNAGKGIIEPFIKAGAFDFIGYSRRTMLENADKISKNEKRDKKNAVEGQIDLFSFLSCDTDCSTDSYENLPEYPKKELLRMEKEVTGTYISGHPLEAYADFADKLQYNASYFEEDENGYKVGNGEIVKVCGMIKNLRKVYTKNSSLMCFLTLEDYYGDIPVTVFPKQYEKYSAVLQEDNIIVVTGSVSIDAEHGVSILSDGIRDINSIPRTVWIQIPNAKMYVDTKEEISKVKQENGKDSIVFYVQETKEKFGRGNCLSADEATIDFLKNKFGQDNVKVTIQSRA